MGIWPIDVTEDAQMHEQDRAPRRLMRDPSRRRLGGVCAGIARHYDLEPWIVRLAALTALIFFPSIVFPGYWIAFFVLERPAAGRAGARDFGRDRGTADRPPADPFRSTAPEFGALRSPRQGLRDVRADLAAVELRLRRMEAHVTADSFELDRALRGLDRGAPGASGGSGQSGSGTRGR